MPDLRRLLAFALEYAVGRQGASEQGQQHLETLDGLHIMGNASGHQDDFAGGNGDRSAANDDLGFTVQDLNESMKRNRVLGQGLTSKLKTVNVPVSCCSSVRLTTAPS
jgi:hypothetical protein